jgi:glycosyltransferase involved in cell wall biosynthesis
MRILIAHNRYQQKGGEDAVVDTETSLLRDAGHDVETLFVSNDEIVGLAGKLRAMVESLDNPAAATALIETVSRFAPDIVHFHNTFPRLTPGAVAAVLDRGVPVVQTLHNFRLVCAGALFLRDGQICEKCLGGSRWPAVRHRCYRGSAVGSALVGRVGRRFRELYDAHPDRYVLIALSDFAKAKLVADGFAPDRIAVKGNTARDPGVGPEPRERRIVFVGRLSPEKGADLLLRIAESVDATVEIVGEGPEMSRLARSPPPNVVFTGRLPHEAALARIKSAAALALPSRVYEGFPVVIPEAFAAATPVLAPRLGALPELVTHGTTGWVLPAGDVAAWIGATREAIDDPVGARRLGRGARAAFETRYAAPINRRELEMIYAATIRRQEEAILRETGRSWARMRAPQGATR